MNLEKIESGNSAEIVANKIYNNDIKILNESYTIYNVTHSKPLGNGYYTEKEAIKAVPKEVRKNGIFITYQSVNGWILKQFIGDNINKWENSESWKIFIDQTSVIDNLTGGSADKVLSAEQGKHLNEIKANRSEFAVKYPISTGQNGYKRFSDGVLVDVPSYKYVDIELKTGQTLNVLASGASLAAIIAVYINGVYEQSQSITGTVREEKRYSYTAIKDCVVSISTEPQYSPNNYYYIDGELVNMVWHNKQEIESLEQTTKENINSMNALFDRTSVKADFISSGTYSEKGYYNYDEGKFVSISSGFYAKKVELKVGDKISYAGALGTAGNVLTYFDKDGNYQQANSIKGQREKVVSGELTATEDCIIRLSIESAFATPQTGYQITTPIIKEIDNNTQNIKDLSNKIIEINGDIDDLNSKLNNAIQSDTRPLMRDLNIVLIISQSLGVGGGSQGVNNKYYNSLFSSNGITLWNTTDIGNLKPVTNGMETAVRSMNQVFLESLMDSKNIDDLDIFGYQTVILVYGSGGAPLDTIIGQKEKIKTVLQNIHTKANEMGKTCCLPTIGWVQGEADKNVNDEGEAYKTKLKDFWNELNNFSKSEFVQKDVQFVTYQFASYEAFNNDNKRMMIPIKHYELAQEMPNVSLGTAMYQMPYNADITHPWLFGTRMMGAGLGLFAQKRVIEQEEINCISYLSHQVIPFGKKYVIEIEYSVPYAPLVIDKKAIHDTSVDKSYKDFNGIVPVQNIGFEIMRSDWRYGKPEIWTHNNSEMPTVENWHSDINIESATIVRGNTIRLVCDKNPTGFELWYARRGNQCGGFVRDSMFDKTGHSIYIDASKTTDGQNANIAGNYPINNWMPIMLIKL